VLRRGLNLLPKKRPAADRSAAGPKGRNRIENVALSAVSGRGHGVRCSGGSHRLLHLDGCCYRHHRLHHDSCYRRPRLIAAPVRLAAHCALHHRYNRRHCTGAPVPRAARCGHRHRCSHCIRCHCNHCNHCHRTVVRSSAWTAPARSAGRSATAQAANSWGCSDSSGCSGNSDSDTADCSRTAARTAGCNLSSADQRQAGNGASHPRASPGNCCSEAARPLDDRLAYQFGHAIRGYYPETRRCRAERQARDHRIAANYSLHRYCRARRVAADLMAEHSASTGWARLLAAHRQIAANCCLRRYCRARRVAADLMAEHSASTGSARQLAAHRTAASLHSMPPHSALPRPDPDVSHPLAACCSAVTGRCAPMA